MNFKISLKFQFVLLCVIYIFGACYASKEKDVKTAHGNIDTSNDIKTTKFKETAGDSNEIDETVSADNNEGHCHELSNEEKEMIKKQKEFDELKEWADNIPVLKREDDKLVSQLKTFVKEQKSKDLPE